MAKKIEDAIREAEDREWFLWNTILEKLQTTDSVLDEQEAYFEIRREVTRLRAAQARGETTVEDGAEARRQETGGSHD